MTVNLLSGCSRLGGGGVRGAVLGIFQAQANSGQFSSEGIMGVEWQKRQDCCRKQNDPAEWFCLPVACHSPPNTPTPGLFKVLPRGIMPIQTKGAHAPSDFWAKWILNAPSKRQKIAESYFYIWYNHTGVIRSFSASNHQPLNSNLSSLAGAEPETDVFLQRCIITNHTWFCWPYECKDQSEAFRWVIAET